MNYEQFEELLMTICQRVESSIRSDEDFVVDDIPIAIDGIRYVPEYVSGHKDEIIQLINQVTSKGNN